MGSLAKIVKEFDGSGDTLEAQKEVIQTLAALAESKLEIFTSKIDNSYLTAGESGNPTFPISRLLKSWGKTHAYSEDSATVLSDKLKEATSGFLSGGGDGISNGIFKLVDAALIALFVDSVANEGKDELYFVYCRGGVVTRLDMCAWYRNVSATAITKKMQKSSCFIIREASINCKDVDWYSFITVVRNSYLELGLTKQEYDDAVKAAEDDFVKGGGIIPPSPKPTTIMSKASNNNDIQAQYRAWMNRKSVAE